MAIDLYGMSFSPYSEKARWALTHHRLAYRWHEHVPMVGEIPLRIRAGSIGKKASVPLAVDGDVVLRDSLSIARHAERTGTGAPLRPDDPLSKEWDEKSTAALGAGRVLVVLRGLADREALRESLPGWFPGFLRGIGTPIAASASRFLLRKYGADGVSEQEARETMRRQLFAMRGALGGRPTLGPSFSYADLTMAVVLQMVSPVDDRYIRLGPARRRAWTDDLLSREFADLVAWRDRIYREHRGEA
jgi:glutathione S-transferase